MIHKTSEIDKTQDIHSIGSKMRVTDLIEKLYHFGMDRIVKVDVPILRNGDNTELDIVRISENKDKEIIIEID